MLQPVSCSLSFLFVQFSLVNSDDLQRKEYNSDQLTTELIALTPEHYFKASLVVHWHQSFTPYILHLLRESAVSDHLIFHGINSAAATFLFFLFNPIPTGGNGFDKTQ